MPLITDKDKGYKRCHKYNHFLEVIINAVHYLGKQIIAFRGKEINSDIISVNPNNSIALVKIRVVINSILHEHLYSPLMRNATSLHSDSQNEMTDVLGKENIQGDFYYKSVKQSFM